MVGRFLKGGSVTVACLLSGVVWLAAVGSARGLPTLLTGIECAHPCGTLLGVYRVRPRRVELTEADGGELTLRWSSWTPALAVGSGTGRASGAGSSTRYDVRVRASRVRNGRYTRLELTSTAGGKTQHEYLHLGGAGGSPAWES
jgi:hypothetical protein